MSKPVNPQELRRAAGVATPSGSLAFPHLLPGLPQLRKKGGSFLRPVSPKLLEIGPEVCAVFVVLDADKCHAGARHFLHRRADIFGEGLLAPGDAGRFIGWGVVEPLEGACVYRKSDSAIMVMKSAEDRRRYDAARVLDGAMDRSVLVERPMSPQLIIIGGIPRQNPA